MIATKQMEKEKAAEKLAQEERHIAEKLEQQKLTESKKETEGANSELHQAQTLIKTVL